MVPCVPVGGLTTVTTGLPLRHCEAAENRGDFAARGQGHVVVAQRGAVRNGDVDVGVQGVDHGDPSDHDAAAERGRGDAAGRSGSGCL